MVSISFYIKEWLKGQVFNNVERQKREHYLVYLEILAIIIQPMHSGMYPLSPDNLKFIKIFFTMEKAEHTGGWVFGILVKLMLVLKIRISCKFGMKCLTTELGAFYLLNKLINKWKSRVSSLTIFWKQIPPNIKTNAILSTLTIFLSQELHHKVV